MKFLVAILLSLSILLCNQAAFAAPAKPASANRFSETSTLGYVYQLAFAAERLEAMKPLPVSLHVVNPSGAPVTGAKIDGSLIMPAMAMPLNSPSIKETAEPGSYKSLFLLTMSGLWQLHLDATYGSGQKDTVVFSFVGVTPETGEDVDTVSKRLEELFQQQGQGEPQGKN